MIKPEVVREFLDPLPIRVIPGIGPKSEDFLHRQNIRTVKDLSEIAQATLADWFGKSGQRLCEKARGVDESEVSNEWVRKSIGEQETFAQDTRSLPQVTERLHGMAQRLMTKLREKQFAGFRTITLTVRFADFETKNRSRRVKNGTLGNDEAESLRLVKEQSLDLLFPFFDARENPRGKAIRLIGLRLEKLF